MESEIIMKNRAKLTGIKRNSTQTNNATNDVPPRIYCSHDSDAQFSIALSLWAVRVVSSSLWQQRNKSSTLLAYWRRTEIGFTQQEAHER